MTVSTLNKRKSALAEHVCDTKQILKSLPHHSQRRCLGEYRRHINMNHRALNRDDGNYLPQKYISTLLINDVSKKPIQIDCQCRNIVS